MTAVFITQIEIDGNGVAWIAGTKIKVTEVVAEKLAHGWSPEETHFQHPNLTLAQIHGALTFYYENKADIDAQILRRAQDAERTATSVSDPAFRQRLLGLKSNR